MKEKENTKKTKKLKRIFIWTAIVLAIYTICGFLVLPAVLKSVAITKLTKNLDRQVIIQDIDINPYMLSATIKGLSIKARDGSSNLASFDRLYLNVQLISAVKLGVIVKELSIQGPAFHIVRKNESIYNFSDLLNSKQSEKDEKAKPFRFSLANIQILDGRAVFSDTPKGKTHRITDLNLTVPFLSNFEYDVKIDVEPSFSAKVNDTLVSLQGKTKPFADSLETSFDLNFKDLDIPHYLSYLPFKRKFELTSGTLDTETKLSYFVGKNQKSAFILTGTVTLKSLAVNDDKGNALLRLPKLDILIAPSKLLSGQLNLSRILVDSPELHLHRERSGKTSIQSVLFEGKEKTSNQKKDDQKRTFIVNAHEMYLAKGRVLFSDLSFPEPFKTVLYPLDIKVTDFSNSPGKKTKYQISCKTDGHEEIEIQGNFSIDPLESEGRIDLKKIPVKRYSPYYQDHVLFDVIDSVIGLKTNYEYAAHKEREETKLSDMSVSVSSKRLKKRGEAKEFLSSPLVSIEGAYVDLKNRHVEVGQLSTKKALINARRDKSGHLNLLTLLPERSDRPENKENSKDREEEKPYRIMLKKVMAEKCGLEIEDLVPSRPVTLVLKKININGQNISTKKDARGKISASFRIGDKGSFSAVGPVGIDPLFAEIKLDIKNINVRPLQAYFTDRVRILVTDGRISTGGKFLVGPSTGRGLMGGFKGKVLLNNFASVDKANGDDFLKWASFYLGDIDISYNPARLSIGEIALTDFYSSLIVCQDGSLNLQKILKEEEVNGETPGKPPLPEVTKPARKDAKPSRTIGIKTVTLQGGKIEFTDRFIKPSYSATLTDVAGRVSGLSSEKGELADVSLMGKLDKFGPLEITGKINPLSEDLYADLKIKLKDIELSPMTPYSGRYLGYVIEKGNLHLDLKYKISGGKLDAENKIFLDQFTFGNRMESPDATKLPVNFAVALLKNKKGEINLDVPVKGRLDDPEFSIGGVVIKVLVNLITKAATSPFALLRAIAGGKDDLSCLEFDYGSHVINDSSTKKLDVLVKALHERPSLKLEMAGHVDMEKDREGLRQYFFEKQLKSHKLKEMIKKDLPPVPVNDVKIEGEEYRKYLKMVYKAAKFPKPRNKIGFVKRLPPVEMEKLILTNIAVSDDDMRLLAYKRVKEIKAYILRSGEIEAGRLFLIEPKSLEPKKREKLKESRVDFRLK